MEQGYWIVHSRILFVYARIDICSFNFMTFVATKVNRQSEYPLFLLSDYMYIFLIQKSASP